MSTRTTDVRRWLRIGFLGDGVFKAVLAVVYAAAAGPIRDALDVGAATILIAAGLLFLSGLAECAFALRSAAPSHTEYLIAYDTGWILATLVAVLLMSSGGGFWFGYQAIASALLTVAFATGAVRTENRGH